MAKRYVGEVVELTRDCEIGQAKEKAVVLSIESFYMTLVFPNRHRSLSRAVQTGADYTFLRGV